MDSPIWAVGARLNWLLPTTIRSCKKNFLVPLASVFDSCQDAFGGVDRTRKPMWKFPHELARIFFDGPGLKGAPPRPRIALSEVKKGDHAG